MKRILRAVLFAAAGCTLVPFGALAQAYPVKPIRMVVPFPPGGGVDFTARLFQQRLSASLGQPVIVDNRTGATGAIGEESVSRAAPDGYTILYTVGSDMTMRKFLSKTLALDPVKDFTPIATAVGSVAVIVARPGLPVNSVKELVEYAKRNPGKLSYGSPGVASVQHLTGELLKQQGMDMVHVPFKGLAPALTALVAGEIDLSISNFATAMPQLRQSKIKAIAVLESKRYEGAPEVPALAEALPGFDMPPAWFGFFGPPGLPPFIVSKLNGEIAKAQAAPEVTGKLKEVYLSVVRVPPEQLAAFISATTEAFGRIVAAAGIKAAR